MKRTPGSNNWETRLQSSVEALEEAREDRDRSIRAASKAGISRRKVSKMTGLSVTRVQQIVSGAAVVLLAVLALAGTAQASHARYSHFSMKGRILGSGPDPLVIAANYWNATESCPPSSVHIAWANLLPNEIGQTTENGCTAGDRTIWLDYSLRKTVYRWRCTIVVHEYGHLMGYEHSEDPASVMHSPPMRVADGCWSA